MGRIPGGAATAAGESAGDGEGQPEAESGGVKGMIEIGPNLAAVLPDIAFFTAFALVVWLFTR